MKVKIVTDYKSLKPRCEFSLPDFCVLTGKNGSGKTHLLEAISLNERRIESRLISQVIFEKEKEIKRPLKIETKTITLIPFGQLVPSIKNQSDYKSIKNTSINQWNKVRGIVREAGRKNEENDNSFINRIKEKSFKDFVAEILKKSEIRFKELTEDHFLDFYDFNTTEKDMFFSSQIATIFNAYNVRFEDNRYKAFRNKEYGDNISYLSGIKFEERYGPKPWEMLNEMLRDIKLPYLFNNPEGNRKETEFILKLTNINKNIEIEISDLSTGEKVLMALIVAVYNSGFNGEKPDLILLDEPDAGLHPEFSKLMIDTIKKYIVEKAGIKVVMTTHSPVTVAVADEECIYEMNKEEGIPQKVTKKHALQILTNDMRHLRITTEDRRQVFVESKNDVQYYEKICNLLDLDLCTQPVFLAPRSSGTPNSDDVIKMVNSLESLGNDLIYGVVDNDNINVETDRIKVLGDGNRYAIENYIFDPLFVGLALIREGIKTPSELSLNSSINYINCNNCDVEDFQEMIYKISEDLGFLDNNEKTDFIQCNSVSGARFLIPEEYLKVRGHDLEEKILETYPELNQIKRDGGDDVLKNHFIDTVLSDFPGFISEDFKVLLNKIR